MSRYAAQQTSYVGTSAARGRAQVLGLEAVRAAGQGTPAQALKPEHTGNLLKRSASLTPGAAVLQFRTATQAVYVQDAQG